MLGITGNYEFGISRVIKSLEPYNKKLGMLFIYLFLSVSLCRSVSPYISLFLLTKSFRISRVIKSLKPYKKHHYVILIISFFLSLFICLPLYLSLSFNNEFRDQKVDPWSPTTRSSVC